MALTLLVEGISVAAENDSWQLTSPDGRCSISVALDSGKPSYEVRRAERIVIQRSQLGLRSDEQELDRSLAFDRAEQIAVKKSIEVARQSALDANFRGAAFPGFARAANDFTEGKRVGVGCSGPTSKAAKTASDETDIREIDVSIYNVSDGVADGFSAQLIGENNEGFQR